MRGMLFPDIGAAKDALGQTDRKPLVSLAKVAMDVETNTILFYQEMSSLIEEAETKNALSKIIKEEQDHLIKIKNIRVDLDPFYASVKYGRFF